MFSRTNIQRNLGISSRSSALLTSSRSCFHTIQRELQPRLEAECSKAASTRSLNPSAPCIQARWNSSSSKSDANHSQSIFSAASSWNQVVAEPDIHIPTAKRSSQASSRPVDLKAQEQRAFADLFDEIFKAAEVASASEPAGEEKLVPSPSAPAFPSEFYERIRRTPGKPKFGQVMDEELDKKKEEMNLCRTDYELLDWVLVDVFAEAQVFEEEARKMDTQTRTKRNITLRPSWYPHIIAFLMQTFRDKYKNPHTALAIFNYAKTASIASYAFGCSTDAYNEVIQTYWSCFRDANAVLDAIKEMQVNGVKMNSKTAKLIDTIRRDVPVEKLWSEDELSNILAQLDAIRRDAGGDLTSKKYKTQGMKYLDQWKNQELRDDPQDERGFNKW